MQMKMCNAATLQNDTTVKVTTILLRGCLFADAIAIAIANGHVPLPAVFALKAFVNGRVNILPCFNNTENVAKPENRKRKSEIGKWEKEANQH